jgi:HEAT repeat protein
MRAFLCCLVLCLSCLGAAQEIVGLWTVSYPETPNDEVRKVWAESSLRFRANGTYQQYGGIGMSGHYKVAAGTAHLTIEKLFYQEVVDFGDAGEAMQSWQPSRGLDLEIRSGAELSNVNFPRGATLTKVVWQRTPKEEIGALIARMTKIRFSDLFSDSHSIGGYVYDELDGRRAEAIPKLIGMLGSHVTWLRVECMNALAHLKAVEAKPSLIAALREQDLEIARPAARALGAIRAKDAIDALIQALPGQADFDVADALAEIGDKRAVPALIDLLEKKGAAAFFAIDALVKLKDPRALPALRKLESSEVDVIQAMLPAAIRALDPADPYPASRVPDLIHIVSTPGSAMRWQAIKTLGALRDKRAVPALVIMLDTDDDLERSHAVAALGQIGDKSVVPAVRKLLRDPEESVRIAAREALALLTKPAPVKKAG